MFALVAIVSSADAQDAAPLPSHQEPADLRTITAVATPGLVGQLEFNVAMGSATMVAIPLADNLPQQALARVQSLFAFVVHEAFHQFQRATFGEIDVPSEERHPILDAENSARAALEIYILEDAV